MPDQPSPTVIAATNGTSPSALVERMRFAQMVGLRTYNGDRDTSRALGYSDQLSPADYRLRYERGGIAERIVEALPNATWGDGVGVVENPDRNVVTPFESAIEHLTTATDLWSKVVRADILAGLGEYAVIVIGTRRGALTDPLPKMTDPSDVVYLTPVAQEHAKIASIDTNTRSPRYGLPLTYDITFGTASTTTSALTVVPKTTAVAVHHTRVIHIADGALDNDLIGKPRLRACWNYLDDLTKLIGGGSEAAWRRMDPGMQLDMDPDMELDDDEEAAMAAEVDEYIHGLSRTMRTRGVKANVLSATVAGFGANASAILNLISATSTIPQRILMGSERGQLSSEQDRNNWADRISERRKFYGEPIIRDLVDRLIEFGALPKPTMYYIEWSRRDTVPIKDKANAISAIALANKNQWVSTGEVVVTANEIRDLILGMGPLGEQRADVVAGNSTGNAASVGRSVVTPVSLPSETNTEPVESADPRDV